MSSKNLYDEAIAEAKLLRETAEQNAKNAIIEAVTPKIREFIEEQLMTQKSQSETPDDDNSFLEEAVASTLGVETDDDAVELDESALSSLISLLGGELGLETSSSEISKTSINDAINEAFNDLGEHEKQQLSKIIADLSYKEENFNSKDIFNDDKQEKSTMAEQRDTLYDIDLDTLGRELGSIFEAAGSEDNMPDTKITLDEDEALEELMRSLLDEESLNEDVIEVDLGDDVELPDDVTLTARVVEEEPIEDEDLEFEEEEGDEDIDVDVEDILGDEGPLDEIFEVDEKVLRSELRRLRMQISEGKGKDLLKVKGISKDMAHHWGGTGAGKSGDDFGGGKRGVDPLKVKLNTLKERYNNERRNNRSLKNKLSEYRSAVETLREQLTDINLFNAKLLYVNKLLQNKDIGSSQRKTIIKSLDDAKSLREVKLLYRSLTQSLISTGKGTLKESAVRRNLGTSSRATSRSSASSQKLAEVNRWAELAGLKEN